MEERKLNKSTIINNLTKIIVPRDLQNANSVINSKNNLNKYSWEKDGEEIISNNKYSLGLNDKRLLKVLLLKKIPDSMRPKIWMHTSGAKREMSNNPEYYKNLTENFPYSIPSPFTEQIELDVRRTFPDDPMFRKEEILNKLKNILLAYSRRNITIGYCQGFNFIVGKLLKIFCEEEEAFWMFVQIIENYLPLNYYSNMCGVMVDSAIINRLLEIYMPDLYNHVASLGYEMSLNNIIYKWLVSIYAHNLPEKITYIIWDVFFLDGSQVLFKSAIGIFKALKKVIMAQNTTEGIQNVLDEYPMFIDESAIVYCLILRKFEFDSEFIDKNRFYFGKNIIDNYFKARMEKADSDKKKMLLDLKDNKISQKDWKRNSYFKMGVSCNMEWPLCIYDTYYKFYITEFFVFRTMDSPKFIENYFFALVDDNRSDRTFIGSTDNLDRITKNFSGIKTNIKLKRKNIKVEEENSENEDENSSCERGNSENKYFLINNSSRNLNETKCYKMRERKLEDSITSQNESNECKSKLFENYYEKCDDDFNNINEISNYIEEHENENAAHMDDSAQNEKEVQVVIDKFEKIHHPFDDLIIERRQHFCNLLTPKTPLSKDKFKEKKILSFSEQNSFNSIDLKQRSKKRTQTGRMLKYKNRFLKYKIKKNHNRSFTAVNPYLLINFEKTDNQKICSNIISTIRKNFDGIENQFLSISEFNLLENPFSPKEDDFTFPNVNENDEI